MSVPKLDLRRSAIYELTWICSTPLLFRFELEDFEHVTCLKNVYLKSEGTVSGLKGYIALSTNFSYSEDVTSRGRVGALAVIFIIFIIYAWWGDSSVG